MIEEEEEKLQTQQNVRCVKIFSFLKPNYIPFCEDKVEHSEVNSVPYWLRIRKLGDHCHVTGKYRELHL